MSPVPKGTRFRIRTISPTARVRLAYKNNKIVEVKSYRKKNGKWVASHNRRPPRK